MKSPATTLPAVPAPLMWTPAKPLPEITSRSAARRPVAVGPDVVARAPASISTPFSFGSACVPAGSVPRKSP